MALLLTPIPFQSGEETNANGGTIELIQRQKYQAF